MSGCAHERLDPSHQKISAPPFMRCFDCGEWVSARGYCWDCGRKGTTSYEPENAPLKSAVVILPMQAEAVYRLTCSVCGSQHGARHFGSHP